MHPPRQDWSRLKVFPLETRHSMTRVQDILLPASAPPPPVSEAVASAVHLCADRVRAARQKGAAVILMYGAHLLRNGAASILGQMMSRGWITHVATNGAGTIHDWEYAWLGRSTESVEKNVATGSFGAWDETGRNIHLALLSGALQGDGYGVSLGRFISEDGTQFPSRQELLKAICDHPTDPSAGARLDLLRAMDAGFVPQGPCSVQHPFKDASILSLAYRHQVPATVHPGIGYDIIATTRCLMAL